LSKEIFRVEGLSHSYDSFNALANVSFSIREHEIVGIVGPNGAGKTTLLRVLCGLLRGWDGSVSFQKKPLPKWGRVQFAQAVAYLPQQSTVTFPYTAREIVLMGRLPHQDGRFFETREDHEKVDNALRLTGCSHLADRYFADLSGGEKQLVALASALAQQPSVLLLDEPTVFLDLRHQLEIYRVLVELHEKEKLTLLLVTHDLNLADAFCTRLIFLKGGIVAADLSKGDDNRGSFEVEPGLIESVFGVKAQSQQIGNEAKFLLSL
jgi:iron complex transport system ATP-binding protein